MTDNGHSPNGHRRAILYPRVSTDEQAEHGYSLDTQLEALREYAQRHGLEIAAELSEDYTGTRLDRPQLDKARAMLAAGQADAIVFHTADRMTRNLAHSLLLREEWQRLGVDVHTVTRGKSENTAEARMTENIEAVFAEYWREKIIEGSRRGRQGKAARNKWVGTGHAPYGYTAVGHGRERRLVIDPAKAAVVQRVFRLYLGLEEGRLPLAAYKIGALLSSEGIPTPNTGRAARGWYDSTIKRILKNQQYIGEFRYGAQVAHLPELAIVDPLTWNAAQGRLAKNRLLNQRNRKHDYLITGHLTCSCGRRMVGRAIRARWRYYACIRKTNHMYLPNCPEGYLPADRADAAVWKWMDEWIRNPEALQLGIARMEERDAAALKPTHTRLADVRRLIARTEGELKELAQEVRKVKTAKAKAALRAEMDTAGKYLEALEGEQAKLEAQVSRQSLSRADQARLLAKADEICAALDEGPDFETKRYFLDRLGFTAELWHDDQGLRWLHVACGLGEDDLPLGDSRLRAALVVEQAEGEGEQTA